VVCLLHGYGGKHDTFNVRLATLPDSADNQMKSGTVKEMIVVMRNAYTLHEGGMYSNSETTAAPPASKGKAIQMAIPPETEVPDFVMWNLKTEVGDSALLFRLMA
jgi:hypothetical protein